MEMIFVKKLILILFTIVLLTSCDNLDETNEIDEPITAVIEQEYSNLDDVLIAVYNQLKHPEYTVLYDNVILIIHVENEDESTRQLTIQQLLFNMHKEDGDESKTIVSSCSPSETNILECNSLDELPVNSTTKLSLSIDEFIEAFTSVNIGDLEGFSLEGIDTEILSEDYYIYSLIEFHTDNDVLLGETNIVRVLLEDGSNELTAVINEEVTLDGYYIRIDIRESEQHNSVLITYYYKLPFN